MMIKRGFIYGITGLFFEVIWTGLCSLFHGDLSLASHTALIMLPIYGLVVFMEPMFFTLTSLGINPFLRGIYYAALIFACEYFSGKLLGLFNLCPWRYSGIYSIDGLVRLDYAPLWFTAGLVYEKIYLVFFEKGKPVFFAPKSKKA